jgi:hypothetical protein
LASLTDFGLAIADKDFGTFDPANIITMIDHRDSTAIFDVLESACEDATDTVWSSTTQAMDS